MENKDRNAFPIPAAANETGIYTTLDSNGGEILGGLTKREYFAAKALQGLLANPYPDLVMNENMAIVAVQQADYLLKELATESPEATKLKNLFRTC